MTRGKRVFIVLAACLGILILGWGTIFAAVYATGGLLTVQIHERQEDIRLYLPVPMVVVNGALAAGSMIAPHDEMLELHLELEEWGPMVREVLEVLDEMPDATLVEVVDGDDHVVVRKEGRSLVIEVDEPDVRVRISVPTSAVRQTIGRLII